MFILIFSHSIIIYHFLSQMAGDKRKGKAVAEPEKKKSRQQKEWERVQVSAGHPDLRGHTESGGAAPE
jgi:hypothetical protein